MENPPESGKTACPIRNPFHGNAEARGWPTRFPGGEITIIGEPVRS
jgi:hypothetical protein